MIDVSRHAVIAGVHPSPLSAHTGFFGSKPFSKVNAALYALEKSGELDRLWAKWLGPNTEYKMVREEKVTPLAELKSLTDLNLQLPLPVTSSENPAAAEEQADSGEVALVPVPEGEPAAGNDSIAEAERLDAAADDDADDEELSAPGNSSAT